MCLAILTWLDTDLSLVIYINVEKHNVKNHSGVYIINMCNLSHFKEQTDILDTKVSIHKNSFNLKIKMNCPYYNDMNVKC